MQVAGYYKTFMEYLGARFPTAYITTVSSLGFHTLANAHDFEMPTYTLKEQTEHKAHYLRQECIKAHDLPVVICGHSIGLHMAMRALEIIEQGSAASQFDWSNEAEGLDSARLQVRRVECRVVPRATFNGTSCAANLCMAMQDRSVRLR